MKCVAAIMYTVVTAEGGVSGRITQLYDRHALLRSLNVAFDAGRAARFNGERVLHLWDV